MPKILLVDDDFQALDSTRKILEFAGYEVVCATDGQQALEEVRPHAGNRPEHTFDAVVTDVRMPKLGGLEFLRALSLCGENIPVILMTAYGRVEDAVWAMKLGAVDFLTKPFKKNVLLASIEAALKRNRSQSRSGLNTQDQLPTTNETAGIVGNSALSQQLKIMIQQVAPTAATVLIRGESGTGKELVARCLHQLSSRGQRKYIAVNCGAVPESLMESELFGFEKGAFTGATSVKVGLFEAAHGGTLLLDEIGDLPMSLQSKLLRVLQEGEIRRLGSVQSRKIDVRVIAATHKNLKDLVQQGLFRQDLLYRLEVVEIHVPALRERQEDIPDLIQHFLQIYCSKHGKPIRQVADEALRVLKNHTWPGNVRELANVLERAVIFSKGNEITLAELPSHLVHLASPTGASASAAPSSSSGSISVPLGTSLKDVEELLIRKTLEATDGDKNMTAKLLGINSRTIYRKLDKKPD